MDKTIRETLQLDVILDQVAAYTHSDYAADQLRQTPVQTDLKDVRRELGLTHEAHRLLSEDVLLTFFNLDQIAVIRTKLDQGRLLTVEQLKAVQNTLVNWRRLSIVLHQHTTEIPFLMDLLAQQPPLNGLRDRLDDVLDLNGIRDDATPELAQLRKDKAKQTRQIQQQLNQFIGKHSHELQGKQLIRRDQHYCVQLKATYKHKFKGTVMGQSATGSTVFFEPSTVSKTGLELAATLASEEGEVYQILATMTGDVEEHWTDLQKQIELLSELDQIFARGQYGLEHQAILPKLNGQQALHIVNGRHPLLGETAVPLNVTLDAQQSLMITGANSGGKTVVLKTIALFSMMVKLGLEIPADEGTNLAVFDQVSIDIGDQQNMAAQLSTFSGEMTTLVGITDHLRPNALILLDEIGSGTDPEEGTALGIAIIQYLVDQGAKLVVTTHYTGIKDYAVAQPKFVTGAMAFDRQTLEPEYRLLLNQVGASEAMWLAERIGLKPEILALAKQHLKMQAKK
ncbi:endonuclease MutS2 [Levilactobacillus namurensis]|uniref:DNA mismatch repair proteins mutS family domain-containing protein n=1 Tax=Levilactobacillus namurensis TaxID=380393 RepID=A0AAW8W407_9LACO|nr:hypothetical protein [Levilactobacillus namurensis]MDT7013947.1 hypothetical protein [Levilactobacillus namurensis]